VFLASLRLLAIKDFVDDDNGTVSRSMVELGNEKIEEDKIDDLVNSLFQKIGFENKKEITASEFQRVLKDYSDELNLMSLNMNCELQIQNYRRVIL